MVNKPDLKLPLQRGNVSITDKDHKRMENFNKGFTVYLKLIVPMQKLSHNSKKALVLIANLYHKKFQNLAKSRGIHNALKIMKTARQVFLQYVNGTPVRVTDIPLGIAKNGMPKFLQGLENLLNGEERLEILRLTLTLLSLTKIITQKSEPNYTPITTEYTGEDLFILEYELRSLLPQILQNRKVPSWNEYHMSLKRGPNKGLAIHDALTDLSVLYSTEIYKDVVFLGGPNITDSLEKRLKPQFMVKGSGEIRRLTSFPDKEGKVRNICIADYWTQTVLKPFHEDLMETLKTFKADRTFSQGDLTYLLNEREFYNFDLSDATDRFPLSVQKFVMEHLYNSDVAESWSRVLVTLPFKTQKGSYVHYRTGQPLGLYSSWPAFSLSHHVIVQLAANRAGHALPFERYALLGDDIVICDKDTAHNYQDLMVNTLGVQISPLKTVVGPKILSFASRYFYEGKEISPFTLSGLVESSKDPSQLAELLRTMFNHGWIYVRDLISKPDYFESLVSPFNKQFPKFRKVHRNETKLMYDLPMNLFIGSDLTTPRTSSWEWFVNIRCGSTGHLQVMKEIIGIILYDEIQTSIDTKLAPYVEIRTLEWLKNINHYYSVTGLRDSRSQLPSPSDSPFGQIIRPLIHNMIDDFKFMEDNLFDELSGTLDLESIKTLRKLRIKEDPKQSYINRESKVKVYYDSKLVLKAYRIARRMSPYEFLQSRKGLWEEARRDRKLHI